MGTRRPVHHRTDIASRCSDEIEGVTQFGQKKKKKRLETHIETQKTHIQCVDTIYIQFLGFFMETVHSLSSNMAIECLFSGVGAGEKYLSAE